MKKQFLPLVIFIMCCIYTQAQERFTVNGETLQLEVLVEGELDLLLYHLDDTNRFFIKDANETIKELLNTKNPDGTYSKEYLNVLNDLTQGSNMDASEVGFGRYSLKQFIKAYNSNGNARFAYTDERVKAKARFGVFGGVTNHPFITNPTNAKAPFFGLEFEMFQGNSNSRQAGFFSIEHAFKNYDFSYESTELALGYRYRFIKKSTFNIYGNLKFATYTFSKQTFEITSGVTEDMKNSTFRVPFIFGLGADIKVSESSFITLSYNELVSVFIDNNGNFPIDLAVGYKFDL